jgi:hypothetical protein
LIDIRATQSWNSKMKKLFLMLLPVTSMAFTACAMAQQSASYHAPLSAAEQTLDHVLRLEASGNKIQTAGFFTPQLIDAINGTHERRARENCGADHDREDHKQGVCGINYEVLLCAQNIPDTFLYRTISITDKKAIVAYAWPGTNTDTGVYKLINVSGGWKIDGIDCSGADSFNMR